MQNEYYDDITVNDLAILGVPYEDQEEFLTYDSGIQRMIFRMLKEGYEYDQVMRRMPNVGINPSTAPTRNLGQGFFDIQEDYNKVSRDTLAKYGDLPVIHLELRRHPIPSAISTALKWITGNKVPYDKLYHLSIVATVQGGKKVIVEKLEVVNVSADFHSTSNDEHIVIPLTKSFTIKEMLEKTRKRVGNKTFWDYDAFKNNCQNFVKMNLESVGYYTQAAKDFVYQDLTELIKHTPVFAQKLAKASTYIASLWNKLTAGNKPREKELADDLLEFCQRNNIKDVDKGFNLWFDQLEPRVKKLF